MQKLNQEGENAGSDGEGVDAEEGGSDGSDFDDYIDALQNETESK